MAARAVKAKMRTSATGISINQPLHARRCLTARRLRRPAGFTLIEVLVVVVIIGIISATVLLSVDLVPNDRALSQEGRRLASLIDLAEDEATLQGRDFGLEFTRTGYRFVEHDPFTGTWQPVTDDELLRERKLPDGLQFQLYLEDKEIVLNQDAAPLNAPGNDEGEDEDRDDMHASGRKKADYAPHSMLLSSGEVSPLTLEIHREGNRDVVQVTVDATGKVDVKDDADPAT